LCAASIAASGGAANGWFTPSPARDRLSGAAPADRDVHHLGGVADLRAALRVE